MKTEFVDVNDTRKNVRVEIPSDIVDAEIERQAQLYSRKARILGFRPGKAPARVIKQRFKEQILHDVANDLIPPAVDEALRERGVEAVDTSDIRDITVEAGQPM
jgi:trigger factor